MLIYIIRHGETDLNVKGVVQGWYDEPLNESGRFLAAETGKRMKEIRFDGCFSSPLKRAAETAEIILRESGNDLPITFDDRLKEMSFGEREGTH
ncbi:MAG: histidine phosphatase family protein, partial [Clostridia bacterium]|nr:histidine phosphatase family protein [Clostridia bacterium]